MDPNPGTWDPSRPPLDYEALIADAERVLDGVDRALARLADHSYGTCEECGDAIADQHLAADPTARTCERHLPLAPSEP